MNEWYEKLKARRIRMGMNRKDVADQSGLSERAIGNWERLSQPPRFKSLITWANSLDVSVCLVPYDQTFTEDGRVAYAVDDQEAMIAELKRLRTDREISLFNLGETSENLTRQSLSLWESRPDYSMQVFKMRKWARKLDSEIILVDRATPLYREWANGFTMVLPKPIEGNDTEGTPFVSLGQGCYSRGISTYIIPVEDIK